MSQAELVALVAVVVFVLIGLPLMVCRQNEYAQYVQECEKKKKIPLDYRSWKASTGRGGIA